MWVSCPAGYSAWIKIYSQLSREFSENNYFPVFHIVYLLQAETLEELREWEEALENALAQAPSATLAVGQNGVLNKDQSDAATAALASDSPEKRMCGASFFVS